MSYATRGARAGEMAWPPLSRPGDTPHPPYGAPPSLPRLFIVAPVGCPYGPSQQLPRADRGHLGVGGWQGTGFLLGFSPVALAAPQHLGLTPARLSAGGCSRQPSAHRLGVARCGRGASIAHPSG